MNIDTNLIESLLYEEEGVELDFKRDQYRLANATDDEKSEIIKDILAFSNAWRRSDAFILIGTQEIKGSRSNVVGISDQLDDAALQQLINAKTNRPISFSYRNLTFEGKQVAVIHIPVQQRPIYLNKDFGKLKANTVYLRRGSSTMTASPDEISRMGAPVQQVSEKPELEIFFAEPTTRTSLGYVFSARSLWLQTPELSRIPEYSRRDDNLFGIDLVRANSSYYKELVKFTKISKFVFPVHIAVHNTGAATADAVHAELKIAKMDGKVMVMDADKYPDVPKQEYNPLQIQIRLPVLHDVNVSSVGDSWIIEAKADKIQAKATQWFRSPFYVGSIDNREVVIDAMLFADQLQNPTQQRLLVTVESGQKDIDLNGILELERERFRATPSFQRLLKEQKTKK